LWGLWLPCGKFYKPQTGAFCFWFNLHPNFHYKASSFYRRFRRTPPATKDKNSKKNGWPPSISFTTILKRACLVFESAIKT
jgi:hypothetical protein